MGRLRHLGSQDGTEATILLGHHLPHVTLDTIVLEGPGPLAESRGIRQIEWVSRQPEQDASLLVVGLEVGPGDGPTRMRHPTPLLEIAPI